VATWVARADTAEEVVARARGEGHDAQIRPLSRKTPAGDLLEWRMIEITNHDAGAAMPLFIDWGAMPHPSTTQPTGLTLDSFVIATPHAHQVQAAFDQLQLAVDVEAADESAYRLTFSGPTGSLTVTGTPSPLG
jgi:hypothetical protein